MNPGSHMDMRQFFNRALGNIAKYGDTDIFPFPFETHIFFDKPKEVVDLLMDIDANFADRLRQFPPSNISALAPVTLLQLRLTTTR